MDQTDEGFGVWAILELMGHVKVAGYVTEEELFGSKLGRIDIPADDETQAITQYFGGQSVYRLTPVAEATARAFARRSRPRPVHIYELLPEPRTERDVAGDVGFDWQPKNGDEPPDYDRVEEDFFDDAPF